MEAIIKQAYYDPSTGYQSAKKMYLFLKAKHPDIELKEVQAFINRQEGAQLTKVIRENKKSFIPITGDLGNWQIDLMFYTDHATVNKNFGVFLVGIEINSRYCFVAPMKLKNATTAAMAIMKLYMSVPDPITPTCFTSDNGKEFKNSFLKEILYELEINQYFAQPKDHHKLGKIDRMILTLRTIIEHYCAANNTSRFIDVLSKLVENYNSSPHSSLANMSPIESLTHLDKLADIEAAVKASAVYGAMKVNKFKKGDQVRISKHKNTFDKGTSATFGNTVRKVEDVSNTRVVVNGRSYAIERLQKIGSVEKAPEKKSALFEEVQNQHRDHARTVRKVRNSGIDVSNILDPGTVRTRGKK